MADFDITIGEEQNNIIMMHLEGYLDAHTFDQLEDTIENLFDNDFYQLVIDLSGLEYISSAGAGVFIGALGTAQENGGDIVFLNPTDEVREIFDLLGLSQIFRFYEQKTQALQSLDNS